MAQFRASMNRVLRSKVLWGSTAASSLAVSTALYMNYYTVSQPAAIPTSNATLHHSCTSEATAAALFLSIASTAHRTACMNIENSHGGIVADNNKLNLVLTLESDVLSLCLSSRIHLSHSSTISHSRFPASTSIICWPHKKFQTVPFQHVNHN